MTTKDSANQTNKRLQLFADLSSDWYWELDSGLQSRQFSKDLTEVIGVTRKTDYGRNGWILSMSDSESDAWLHHQEQLKKNVAFKDFEHKRLNESGEVVWLSSSGDPVFNSKNEFAGYCGTCQLITEQKKSDTALIENEERLRLSVNMCGIGIWEWDMISDHVVWDKRQFQLFGRPEEEGKIELSSITDVIHPDDREQLNKTAKRVLDDGECAAEEFRIILPDGTVRWLLGSSGVVKFYDNGASALLVGVNMDITDSKQLEISLRENESNLQNINSTLESRIAERTVELKAEAERHTDTQSKLATSLKLKAIGQLAGGVAHDFNNLLAIIGGNLELALPNITHAGSHNSVSKSLAAVDSGIALNRRLLAFARKRNLNPVNLFISSQLLGIVSLIERTLGGNITITTSSESVSWVAYVDPGEFDSAIINLSINARDAMGDGGQLDFEIRNCILDKKDVEKYPNASPGEYVALILTDNGTGMSDEVLQQACDPFFTTKKDGTGLGLSSTYGFIQQSGGFLSIHSQIGVGTTVGVFLPRVFTEPDCPDSAVSAIVPKENTSAKEELILVVEDDPMVCELTVMRLNSIGYQTIQASSGQEAIALLKVNMEIKLVFSDIVMVGGMSGYELAQWVIDKRPEVRILLTSGYFDHELLEASNAAGNSFPVLEKPYQMNQLSNDIRKTLDE